MSISLNVIPKGSYCYDKQGVCPHWEKTEIGAKCHLLDEEHTYGCCYHLVWDQVKECGKKEILTIPEEYKRKQKICDCGKIVNIYEYKNGDKGSKICQ